MLESVYVLIQITTMYIHVCIPCMTNHWDAEFQNTKHYSSMCYGLQYSNQHSVGGVLGMMPESQDRLHVCSHHKGRSVGWSHVCFCHTTEGDMYSCVPNVLQLFSLCNSKYPLRLRLWLWLGLRLRLRLRMNGNVKRSQGESQRVTDRRRRATEQIGISPDVIQLHFISPGRGWIWKILVANIHMRALEDYS